MIIVGICGASGSGKSTLAKRIMEGLSCPCEIVGQDCYYRSYPEIPLEERRMMNFDDPSIFDYDDLITDVMQLQNGLPITRKGYDYTNHVRLDHPDLRIDPPKVLILEGIHIFYDKRLREMMDLKVYIQVDADICLLRRIRRDIKSRGRTIDSISEQYLSTVKPMFEKYVQNYIKDADIAILRGGKNQMAIDAICAYLESRMIKEYDRSV
jgi:uridine kinase